MKLIIFFIELKTILSNYSIIIERLILYNELYNGKLKEIINRNLNTIKYLIIILESIQLSIIYKNIDEFFDIFESLKIDDYNLKEFDKELYLYHINMNDYKIYVELFEFFKNIIKNIKKFCDDIKEIKTNIINKIKEIKTNINNNVSSSSSGSLNIYKSILISQLTRKKNYQVILSSSKNNEEIIKEIIINLIRYHINDLFEDLKKFILNYYNIKEDRINEDYIIIKIIYYVLLNNNHSITDIKEIINNNYIKKNNSIEDKYIIDILINSINKILRINSKIDILIDIKNQLNINQIFILDEYIKDDDYKILILNITIIENKLRVLDNTILKKIYKIISKFNKYKVINNDLNKLDKFYKFINSINYIYINDIDKIYYFINETNNIKKEFETSDLFTKEIKDLFIEKFSLQFSLQFTLQSYDNIAIETKKYSKLLEKNKNYIIKVNFNYIKDIMKIIELYHKIVSNNLTDKNINDIVIEILKINNHDYYDYLYNEFVKNNLYYKIDYNIIFFDNNYNFKKYLEKFYIYKNYINVIIKLYEYLLSLDDNFNEIYITIKKIRNILLLYKKIKEEELFNTKLLDKLNYINDNNKNDYKYENIKDIDDGLTKIINKYKY